jgi:hypothetical protein
MENKENFTFKISLSVLNHLGRNLYRSFGTVLGEAISNAWDADAKNVHIYIDKKKHSFFIKDDGDGMTADDFQGKFLKIGYTKRKEGNSSPKGRPYIGRKGIGKLALLSCAKKITVISKTKSGNYIGGVIDNSGLDKAIKDDLTPDNYPLGEWNPKIFSKYTKNHEKGTIIYFENIHEGIKNSLDFLKKIIALYFRFSLLDSSFNIYIDKEKITHDCLDDLASQTEFLWEINKLRDPYIQNLKDKFELKEKKLLKVKGKIKGFIASVAKPMDLKVRSTDEKVGVDLFVNGRLRERDILRHIPTARVTESYLYGQIHFDGLDDKEDRFTTSREGVIADDPKYKEFLEILRSKIISVILSDWDTWRRKHRKTGDPDDTTITPKERKAEELYNVVSEEYALPKDSKGKAQVDGWVNDLGDDARYNFASYAECFISENLIRDYIQENKIPLSKEAEGEISDLQKREADNKNKGNISIELRKKNTKLSYLSMDGLANFVDKRDPLKEACLSRDAKEYKPIRDALAHTALLTDKAKEKLTTVYSNIRDRIRTLLSKSSKSK